MRAIVLAGLTLLTGCADQLLPSARLRDDTAASLGQPAQAVAITDRTSDGLNVTYFIARTPRGRYACSISGGGALDFGITTAPTCNRL